MTIPPLDLVDFPVPEGLRVDLPHGMREVLTVPRNLFNGTVFLADSELTLVEGPDGSRLVRFGSARLSSALCVEAGTGTVVDIDDETSDLIKRIKPAWSKGFVNSDLARFIDVARAVTGRFPYYKLSDLDPDFAQRVTEELREMIGRIDPPAVVPDRFWSTFLDDVRMGDFATDYF